MNLPSVADLAADVIDTLALAREHFPGKKNNLDALCERLGVANAHRTLHGAMLDAQLLAEVYLAMTRGQESLTIDIAVPMAIVDGMLATETLAAVRVLMPSAEELDLHQAYLAELQRECRGACLWIALTT